MTASRRNQLRFVLVFVVLYGLIPFLIRPEPARGQTIFGLMLVGVGVLGLVWIHPREAKQIRAPRLRLLIDSPRF